jgi:hypothetical protein
LVLTGLRTGVLVPRVLRIGLLGVGCGAAPVTVATTSRRGLRAHLFS